MNKIISALALGIAITSYASEPLQKSSKDKELLEETKQAKQEIDECIKLYIETPSDAEVLNAINLRLLVHAVRKKVDIELKKEGY